MYDKLSGLHLSVEKFDLTVPPSQDAKGDAIPEADQKATSFQLGISATWPQGEEVSLIEGKLAIKGIYLNVVKDDVK